MLLAQAMVVEREQDAKNEERANSEGQLLKRLQKRLNDEVEKLRAKVDRQLCLLKESIEEKIRF